MTNHQYWIAAWGCAVSQNSRRNAEWAKDTTVRMQMLMTVSGSALRFHFSNLFGSEPAVITRASVSVAGEGSAMIPERCVPISFNGDERGVMSAGGSLVSDEIPFSFQAGEVLAVSLYFRDFTQMLTGISSGDSFQERWCSSGDQTQAPCLPFNETAAADFSPFINTIEALCPEECYAIVAFGDSITAQSWPDRLKRRLFEELGRRDVAIVRKAISGNRVLREYACAFHRNNGPRGLDRFKREVLLPGVKKVLILHGINDIIHPGDQTNPYAPISELPTAEELIEGLKFYIDTAHSAGIAVFLSPILPFAGWRTYDQQREAIREKVNHWIYREAPIEGVLPFELALLDPENPLALQPQFDCGDHLHPSADGAQAMADSIPAEFI